jgi:hypothetical protein
MSKNLLAKTGILFSTLTASLLLACGAAPEDVSATDSHTAALSLPTQSYGFSQNLKFCKKVSYGFGKVNICSPSLKFAGSVSLGNFETAADTGIPIGASVVLDMNDPFNSTTTISVGLDSSSNDVCYNASKVDGVDLDVCATPVNYSLNTGSHEVSFQLQLAVKGSIKVSGVGISQKVNLYKTPSITVPY